MLRTTSRAHSGAVRWSDKPLLLYYHYYEPTTTTRTTVEGASQIEADLGLNFPYVHVHSANRARASSQAYVSLKIQKVLFWKGC